MLPAYYEDFSEIKKKIWLMLEDAVSNRNSQFRIPTFICGFNSDINGRIIVLRKADKQNNIVQFHSDIRSDKIEILKKNSNAALLFYDKEEKIQVRLKIECLINHKNEITRASWEKSLEIKPTNNELVEPSENDFKERTFTADDLPSFKYYRIKLVMTSTNQVYVPRVKNLKVLALA